MMQKFSKTEKEILLKVAFDSIIFGLEQSYEKSVDVSAYPTSLQIHKASFVTLYLNKALRGCIGSLEAYQPLVLDVSHNAYAAAFSDPRFMPLTEEELPNIDIHISVLSKPVPIEFKSEQELLSQLKPGEDGLILTENGFRGTFLPSVWDSLRSPIEFLTELKVKAGLPRDYWSDTVKIERYSVEEIDGAS